MAVTWTEFDDSCANSAVTVTHAAEPGRRHYLTDVTVSIRCGTSGNDIRVTILECCTVKWDAYMDSARGVAMQQSFNGPLGLDTNKAAKVTVDAAGAGAVTTVSFGGYSQ